MPHAALLLAAGKGSRLQESLPDKVLAPLAGLPVAAHSARAFLQSGLIETLCVVYRDDEQQPALAAAILAVDWPPERLLWVRGGEERQDSVLAALRALPATTDLVFIHDAARPMLDPEMVKHLAEAAREGGAACLAHRVSDTIKKASRGSVMEPLLTVDRTRLWAMETPQVFRHALILKAYEDVVSSGAHITDDTAALEPFRQPIALVENSRPNPKLTTPRDLAYLEFLLNRP
jgi:2-C-methyl-D-erythritol 4-phosphate cytidylyltransferase